MFDLMQDDDFEEVVFFQDKNTGLKAIVAIHNTVLGPSLGGTRICVYRTELDALRDVLRLAKAMTMKASAAGLNLGGGKAVIIGDPKKIKSEALFRSYGKFIESLGGRYITAEDVGTTVGDMRIIATETRHVTGIELDPSPFTAYGVFQGIKACVEYVYGDSNIEGLKVAVQGLGKVGGELVRLLNEAGCHVIATDVDTEKLRTFADIADITKPSKIFSVKCDVFSPCALGGVINDGTIKKLKCRIIAGGANNQLESERHGEKLTELGILYAPDYIINAGGLIAVAREYECSLRHREINRKSILREIEGVKERLIRIFRMSEEIVDRFGKSVSTQKAADIFAMERIEKVAGIRRMYLP
jgi:leucine dehydrogenase